MDRRRIGLVAIVVALAVLFSTIVIVQVRQVMPTATASETQTKQIPTDALVVDDGAVTADELPGDVTEGMMMEQVRSGERVISLAGLPTIYYQIKTKDKVFFITVDDGTFKNNKAAQYVADHQLPVTSFLTSAAIDSGNTLEDGVKFFERISKFGSIQNHSATHKSLNKSTTDLDHEICYVQKRYKRIFGTQPWMLRPPYGDGPTNSAMLHKAKECGIKDILMWDTSVGNGKVSYRYGKPKNGSIFLLHFGPTFLNDLKLAVATGKKHGLKPANLADYLPMPGPKPTPTDTATPTATPSATAS